jgi:hypothetical protein
MLKHILVVAGLLGLPLAAIPAVALAGPAGLPVPHVFGSLPAVVQRSHPGQASRPGRSAATSGRQVVRSVRAREERSEGREEQLEQRAHRNSAVEQSLREQREAEAPAMVAFGSRLVPAIPSDPTIAGVKPGALPWQLKSGHVLIKPDGRLSLVVHGLVLTTAGGGTGPVKTVAASVFCGGAATTPTAVSTAVPLSASGDATITVMLHLPATCLAPQVFVNPNGATASYIAASGWGA